MSIRRTLTTLTSAGLGSAMLACGACCIPFLTPLVAGLGLGTLGRATDEKLSTYLGVALVVLAVGVWLHGRLRRRPACKADGSCGCAGARRAPGQGSQTSQ